MTVRIKTIKDGKLPAYGRVGDACLDCYANEDIVVVQGERQLVRLGFALALDEGYEAIIRPRSGLSSKGIDIAIGTVDSNYRGELMACVINNSYQDFKISRGDRICQLAIRQTEDISWLVCDELDSTNRGDNGFGSSGK